MQKPAFTLNDMPSADVKKGNLAGAAESLAAPILEAIINWARKGESREKVLFIDLKQYTAKDVREHVNNFIFATNARYPYSASVYYIRWHDDPYPAHLASFRVEIGVCERVTYVVPITDRKSC